MATEVHRLIIEVRGRQAASEAQKVEVEVRQIGDAAVRSEQKVKRASTGMSRALKGIAAGIAALGLARLGRDIIAVGAGFEQLRAQLITVTGSSNAAAAAFDRILEFAKKTPFEVQNITEAYIRLRSVGIEPTNELLKASGDIAAANGRDILTFAEAIVGAVTGETERLKQFGIVARQAGDEMTFIFQGAETKVKKNATEIVAALQAMGETKFSGGMLRQTETLTGRISNFKDAWSALADTIFATGLGDVLKRIATDGTKFLGFLDDAITRMGGLAGVFALLRSVAAEAMAGMVDSVGGGIASTLELVADLAAGIEELQRSAAKAAGPGAPLLGLSQDQLRIAAAAVEQLQKNAAAARKESRDLAAALRAVAEEQSLRALGRLNDLLAKTKEEVGGGADEGERAAAAIAALLENLQDLAGLGLGNVRLNIAEPAAEEIKKVARLLDNPAAIGLAIKPIPLKIEHEAELKEVEAAVDEAALAAQASLERLLGGFESEFALTFRELFDGTFQGFDDLLDRMLNVLLDWLAEASAQWLASALFSGGGGGGFLGGILGGAGGGGGGGGAAAGAFSFLQSGSWWAGVGAVAAPVLLLALSDEFSNRGDIFGGAQGAGFRLGSTFTSADSDLARQIESAIQTVISALGGAAESLPLIAIQVDKDAKRFRVLANGAVVGIFRSMEEALDQALTQGLKGLKGDFAPILQQLIQNSNVSTFEQLLADIEVVASALNLTMSDTEIAFDEIVAAAELLGETLRRNGIETSLAAEDLGTSLTTLRDQIIGKELDRAAVQQSQMEAFNQRLNALVAQYNAEIEQILATSERLGGELGDLLTQALGGGGRLTDSANALADQVGGAIELIGHSINAGGLSLDHVVQQQLERLRDLQQRLASLPDVIAPGDIRGPSRSSGDGGVQQRADRRRVLRAEAARLRAIIAGTSEARLAAMDFQAGLEDLAEEMRKLGGFSDEEIADRLALERAARLRQFLEPLEEIIRAAGESDAETALRALQESREAALEEIGAIGEHWQIAMAAFRIQAEELGQSVIDSLGLPSQSVRNQLRALGESLDFLRENAHLLGLTAEEVGEIVREAGEQQFVSIASGLERLIGEEEEFAAIRERLLRAQFVIDVANLRLQFQLARDLGLLLEEEINLFDDIFGFIDENWEDLLAGLTAATDAAADQISTSTAGISGVSGPSFLDQAAALLNQLTSMETGAISDPIARINAEMDSLLDQFTLVAAFLPGLGTSFAEVTDRIEELRAARIAAVFDQALQPIRDFLSGLTFQDPRLSPAERLAEAQQRFQSLLTRARAGDLAALQEISGAGQTLIDVAGSFFGTSTGAFGSIFDQVTGSLEELLGDGPGGVRPDVAILERQESLQAQMLEQLRLLNGFPAGTDGAFLPPYPRVDLLQGGQAAPPVDLEPLTASLEKSRKEMLRIEDNRSERDRQLVTEVKKQRRAVTDLTARITTIENQRPAGIRA